MRVPEYWRGNERRLRLIGWKCPNCKKISLQNSRCGECGSANANIQPRKLKKTEASNKTSDK